VSSDGESVYVASEQSNSIAHFFRALPPPDPSPEPGPGSQPDPQPGDDMSAPQTVIEKGPKRKTERRDARIRFSASEAGARFECKLDKRTFKPCNSPRRLKRLRPGKHRFAVRAIDGAGNVDPTPARRRWRVVR